MLVIPKIVLTIASLMKIYTAVNDSMINHQSSSTAFQRKNHSECEWKCGKDSTFMSFWTAKFNIKWLFYDEVTRLDIFIDQYFNFYRWWVNFNVHTISRSTTFCLKASSPKKEKNFAKTRETFLWLFMKAFLQIIRGKISPDSSPSNFMWLFFKEFKYMKQHVFNVFFS